MAIIGKFTQDQSGYVGTINTLSFQAEPVRIVAETGRVGTNAPTHRVYAGDTEVGVAWPKRDRAGVEFLNLKLDDPFLPGPIYPSLVRGNDGQSFMLVWSRANSTRAPD